MKIYCAYCGELLEQSSNPYNDKITVLPCNKCVNIEIDEESSEAYKEGYAEGYNRGYRDGYHDRKTRDYDYYDYDNYDYDN